MIDTKTIEKLSKKYSMSADEFIKFGSYLTIKERKKNLQIERFELLSRYGAETVADLERGIKNGKIPEHPAWEDLIEIKNIESEMVEIEGDIRAIQAA